MESRLSFVIECTQSIKIGQISTTGRIWLAIITFWTELNNGQRQQQIRRTQKTPQNRTWLRGRFSKFNIKNCFFFSLLLSFSLSLFLDHLWYSACCGILFILCTLCPFDSEPKSRKKKLNGWTCEKRTNFCLKSVWPWMLFIEWNRDEKKEKTGCVWEVVCPCVFSGAYLFSERASKDYFISLGKGIGPLWKFISEPEAGWSSDWITV